MNDLLLSLCWLSLVFCLIRKVSSVHRWKLADVLKMGQYLAKLQYRQERRLIVSCTVCCYRYCSDERLKTSLYPPYGWQQLMYPQLVTIASHGPSDSGTNKYQTVFARFWLTPILSYSRNSLRVARFLSWYVFALFISTQYFLWRTGWHVCMQNGAYKSHSRKKSS